MDEPLTYRGPSWYLVQIAISNASRTRSVVIEFECFQPTIRREKTSITKATNVVPSQFAT